MRYAASHALLPVFEVLGHANMQISWSAASSEAINIHRTSPVHVHVKSGVTLLAQLSKHWNYSSLSKNSLHAFSSGDICMELCDCMNP